MKRLINSPILLLVLVIPILGIGYFQQGAAVPGWTVFGIRIEFAVFILTLLGIAIYHHFTLQIAVAGFTVLLILRLLTSHFSPVEHLANEWAILLNLLGLLLGFAILAKQFEDSGIPNKLPSVLPNTWIGPLLLLLMVFVISMFLDNIAAAMIGGSIAMVLFKHKVHIGFIAALVAASNAGGAGSVLGDTTTTMMWIDGISLERIVPAYLASIPAFLIFGILAAKQQHAYQPLVHLVHHTRITIQYRKLLACLLILVGAISANIILDFPALGVWVGILIGSFLTTTPWKEVRQSARGTFFLLAIVSCASLMPVEDLPPASWQSAFVLGLVSSVFDNIPLTKLTLDQSNYDWALLAYAVGFGGSITWFGSSAGVAITNLFPEGRNLGKWVKGGWHIALAYIVGFAILFLLRGWNPFDHNI